MTPLHSWKRRKDNRTQCGVEGNGVPQPQSGAPRPWASRWSRRSTRKRFTGPSALWAPFVAVGEGAATRSKEVPRPWPETLRWRAGFVRLWGKGGPPHPALAAEIPFRSTPDSRLDSDGTGALTLSAKEDSRTAPRGRYALPKFDQDLFGACALGAKFGLRRAKRLAVP